MDTGDLRLEMADQVFYQDFLLAVLKVGKHLADLLLDADLLLK